MTYPPTTPGFPAPQQQPGNYGAPAPSYQPAAAPAGPSKLPTYLTAAVAALGLAAYLASFGSLFVANADIGPFGGVELTTNGSTLWRVATLVAALLAAVSLLPKASKNWAAITAVSAVLGLLLVITEVIRPPAPFSVGWALWLVLLFTVLQSAVALAALLYETGVLTAPAPRPRYDQAAYGQYGPPPGGYYGSPAGAQGQPPAAPQQPGYPTQYGAYSSGGPGAASGYGQPDDTHTPPTGFPSYTPPPATGSSQPPAEPSPGTTPGAESSPPGSTPS